MSDSKTPRERLDALLAGLEDEVLRSHRTRQGIADEGVSTEDAKNMRSAIESLIHSQTVDPEQQLKPRHATGTPEAKAKVAQAMEQLSRWAGVVRGKGAGGAALEARMAYSGEPSEKRGKTAEKMTRRQRGESDRREYKDS